MENILAPSGNLKAVDFPAIWTDVWNADDAGFFGVIKAYGLTETQGKELQKLKQEFNWVGDKFDQTYKYYPAPWLPIGE